MSSMVYKMHQEDVINTNGESSFIPTNGSFGGGEGYKVATEQSTQFFKHSKTQPNEKVILFTTFL